MKNAIRLAALFSLVMLISFKATAEDCEVVPEGKYLTIMKGVGDSKRLPTLSEFFDALNEKGEALLEDVNANDVRIVVENPGGEAIPVRELPSIPSKSVGDKACSRKNQDVNGYDCRLRQLRSRSVVKPLPLPEGLSTGVRLKVLADREGRLDNIGAALGCDEIRFANGTPAVDRVVGASSEPLAGSATADPNVPVLEKPKNPAPKAAPAAAARPVIQLTPKTAP